MMRTYTMTWAEIKIDTLFFGVEWLGQDIDPNWIVEFAYHWLGDAWIHIEADPGNTDYVVMAENPTQPASNQIRIYPWGTKTYKWSDVKKENIFYVTGNAWDLLQIIVR